MTKEYHVFTHQDKQHEQAFVFEVDRDEMGIELCEMWMITIQNTNEVRSRVYLDKMLEKIHNTVGGNIDDVDTVIELFKDVLPPEKIQEINDSQAIRELERVSTNRLITANQYAELCHPNTGNIESIVNELLNKKQQ